MSCAALGVAVSGYPAWQERPPAPRTLEGQRLLFLMKTIHHQSGERYGAARIYAELKEQHDYTGSLGKELGARGLDVLAMLRVHLDVTQR